VRYKNVAGRFFGLVTKHACDRRTDGRTDGQNYDSQDRASIAALPGNIIGIVCWSSLDLNLNDEKFRALPRDAAMLARSLES